MTRIIQLTLILSLFAQFGYAQTQPTVRTIEEYRVLFNEITPRLRAAEKDTALFIGKPLLEFTKHLERHGLQVIQFSITPCQKQQELIEVTLSFLTRENQNFTRSNRLFRHFISISFEESKPFQEALVLWRRYQGEFTGELKAFLSDMIIKDMSVRIPHRMRSPR